MNIIWNRESNAPAAALKKIATSFKPKPDSDFILVDHWIGNHVLRMAMRKAKSTEPRKPAFALEGMKYQRPAGEFVMPADDHQLQAAMNLGVWTKKGERGVKYEAETIATDSTPKRFGTPLRAPIRPVPRWTARPCESQQAICACHYE